MSIKAWEMRGGGKKDKDKDKGGKGKGGKKGARNKGDNMSTTTTSSRSGSQTRGATDDQAEGDRRKIEENLREKGLE